jgi:hypothetical protein
MPSFSYKLLTTADLSIQTLQCKCIPKGKLQSYLVLLLMVLYWLGYHHAAILQHLSNMKQDFSLMGTDEKLKELKGNLSET